MKFASQRQRIIAHNIANLDTPNFIQKDVNVPEFQQMLQQAIEHRREGGGIGELRLPGTDEVDTSGTGSYVLTPKTPHGGILFHDRNNRDLDGLMKDQIENATMYRVCADLLKNRSDLMRAAISERA